MPRLRRSQRPGSHLRLAGGSRCCVRATGRRHASCGSHFKESQGRVTAALPLTPSLRTSVRPWAPTRLVSRCCWCCCCFRDYDPRCPASQGCKPVAKECGMWRSGQALYSRCDMSHFLHAERRSLLASLATISHAAKPGSTCPDVSDGFPLRLQQLDTLLHGHPL